MKPTEKEMLQNQFQTSVSTEIDRHAYGLWRDQLVRQIRQMRFRAAMQLNANNLAHYFTLGQEIIRKQREMGWGKGVIGLLSADLTKEFGKGSGYSERNLGYMKVFAEEYPDFPILQVPLAKIQQSPILQGNRDGSPIRLAERIGEPSQFPEKPIAMKISDFLTSKREILETYG